jgi:hypothetical protein
VPAEDMGNIRNAYKILIIKYEWGKRLRKPPRRQKDNIKGILKNPEEGRLLGCGAV